MKRTFDGSGTRRKLLLRRASYALFVLAVASAAYPWATGAYTWLQQRSLRSAEPELASAESPSAEGTSSAEATGTAKKDGPFAGWEEQDLRYWRQVKDGERFGLLVIPELDLNTVIVKGSGEAHLKKGPGWLKNTDFPGPRGNAGISGHRTTYGAPFRHLDRLSKGDKVEIWSPYRVYEYRVMKTMIVKPGEVDVMGYSKAPMLTLSTCHPPYSAKSRLIVQAELFAVGRIK